MSADTLIQVKCTCGKKLKAPAAAAGKKARCPACGTTLYLAVQEPALNPVAPVAPVAFAAPKPKPVMVDVKPPPLPVIPVETDELDSMYDLAGPEKPVAPAVAGSRCPQCNSGMADGAVLCTNCGYDTRTGEAVSGVAVAKPSVSAFRAMGTQQAVDLMAPEGSFLAGLGLSAVFAVVASVLWFVCVWATGYSFSLIAIVIGIAAGAGMKIGQKGFSSKGGAVAAGMTVGAILLAKLVVVEVILLPIASHHDPNASIFKLNSAALVYYFFRPVSLIIMAVGMAAAYRTANGSVKG